jgi:CBS domain-containing protein
MDALKLMSEKDIGALIVKDSPGQVAGILSERDHARKVILVGKAPKETRVDAIMTPAAQMIIVRPEHTLEECMALMTQNHIRHLPVFERQRLVGMISSRDVIKALLEEKTSCIDNLQELSITYFNQLFDDERAGIKS